jgi:putative transposase
MSQQQPVYLVAEQRKALEEMIHKGESSAREQTRARILLLSDRSRGEKRSQAEVAEALMCSATTVGNIRRRFAREGLVSALCEKPRPGKPPKVTGEVEAYLVALTCSEPPQGYVRWTLRLLANRLVALEQVESISHAAVRDVLKKMNLSLGE